MNHIEMLKSYIKNSGLTLREISRRAEEKGQPVSQAYISKILNGEASSPSEQILRVLADVTGGDSTGLVIAAYVEKAPEEMKSVVELATEYKTVVALIYFLDEFLEVYRAEGRVDEELIGRVETLVGSLSEDYGYYVQNHFLSEYPEYAATMITHIKREYFPNTLSIKLYDEEISFSKHVDNSGNPIFNKNPYPDMLRNAATAEEKKVQEAIEEYNKNQINLLKAYEPNQMLRLPVLGSIRAGDPIERLEINEGYTLVDPELLRGREGFALRVQGDSMSGDRILEGDIVIVLKQEEVQPNDIAVVAVEGDFATLKRVKRQGDFCMLVPSNPAMQPELVPCKDVHIIGKVIEVKFWPK